MVVGNTKLFIVVYSNDATTTREGQRQWTLAATSGPAAKVPSLWELTLRAQVESVESVFYARCFFVSISVPRQE
jgi:hypothetical protein